MARSECFVRSQRLLCRTRQALVSSFSFLSEHVGRLINLAYQSLSSVIGSESGSALICELGNYPDWSAFPDTKLQARTREATA
jgi:hypothetical protein